jgi:hypothetical protein
MRLELTQFNLFIATHDMYNLFIAAHDMCNLQLFIIAHDAGLLRRHSRSTWQAW